MNMNKNEKNLIDLQLDQACEQLKSLIKSGKVLPDYEVMWKQFTLQTMRKKSLTK